MKNLMIIILVMFSMHLCAEEYKIENAGIKIDLPDNWIPVKVLNENIQENMYFIQTNVGEPVKIDTVNYEKGLVISVLKNVAFLMDFESFVQNIKEKREDELSSEILLEKDGHLNDGDKIKMKIIKKVGDDGSFSCPCFFTSAIISNGNDYFMIFLTLSYRALNDDIEKEMDDIINSIEFL